ncbi:hypothetical protein DFQ26_009892, partial [Actinomortierella ambigua]
MGRHFSRNGYRGNAFRARWYTVTAKFRSRRTNNVDKESPASSKHEWVDTCKTVLNCLTENFIRLIRSEANSEAEVFEDGDLVATQYKKNLRINRATWQHAAKEGVKLPAMVLLDLRGRSGLIVRIEQARDYPSIVYAGAAHDKLIDLPTSMEGLRKFMWYQRATVLGKHDQVLDSTDTETGLEMNTDTDAETYINAEANADASPGSSSGTEV